MRISDLFFIVCVIMLILDFIIRNKRYYDSKKQKNQTYRQIKESLKIELKEELTEEIKQQVLSEVRTDTMKFQADMLTLVDKK